MSADLIEVCYLFNTELGSGKMKAINAIEFLGGVYYAILAVLGFRNIYQIFIV